MGIEFGSGEKGQDKGKKRTPSAFNVHVGSELKGKEYPTPPRGMGGRRDLRVHAAFTAAVQSYKPWESYGGEMSFWKLKVGESFRFKKDLDKGVTERVFTIKGKKGKELSFDVNRSKDADIWEYWPDPIVIRCRRKK